MSTFGSKEHWMEPMNTFLTSHRQQFKDFLDNICSVPSSTTNATPMPPSYSTPLAILQRLPPTSREGFPSLPYLIDHARNFAALVILWLDGTTNTADGISVADGDLLKFHEISVSLDQRTRDCLSRAERAERPSSSLSLKYEELIEQLEASMTLDISKRGQGRSAQQPTSSQQDLAQYRRTDDEGDGSSSTASTPITMAPRPSKHRTYSTSGNSHQPTVGSATTVSSRYAPSSSAASASASASASAAEETPPGSAGTSWPGEDPRESTSSTRNTTHRTTSFHRSAKAGSATLRNPPGSSSSTRATIGSGVEESDEEYTTALPTLPTEPAGRDKDRDGKERIGLRGMVPGFKKRKG